jgi:hypothetical protein
MHTSPTARVFRAWTAALAIVLAAGLPSLAQGQEQITICHRTGSATAPWVFLTIDARVWPEYEAQGAKRASTLAECADPPPATAEPAPAVAQQQPVAQSTVAVAQSTPVPTPTLAPPTPVPTPAPTAAPTAAPTVETAGVAVAQTESVAEVSSLPKSGGEPDRRLLVAGLLAIAIVGLALRQFARGAA